MMAALVSEQGPSAGSTLVEVLVAFTIVSVVVVMSLQLFGDGLRQTSRAQAVTAALTFARSLLVELETGGRLRLGTTAGELPDGGRWRVSVTEAGGANRPGAARPLWVEVEVGSGGRPLARLTTIMISRPEGSEAE